MKRWKPGQLVTIDRKVFRITKNNSKYLTCLLCQVRFTVCGTFPCYFRVPPDCYLEQVYPRA